MIGCRLCVLTFPLWIIKYNFDEVVEEAPHDFGRYALCRLRDMISLQPLTNKNINEPIKLWKLSLYLKHRLISSLPAFDWCSFLKNKHNKTNCSFMLTVHCRRAAGLSFLQINEPAYYFPNCLLAQLTLWGTSSPGMSTVAMISSSSLVQACVMLFLQPVF